MGKREIAKLQKAQNRTMRTILQVGKYTSVRRMMEALQFMLVRQRIEYNVIVFIYKMVNELFSEEEARQGRRVKVTGRITRQSENLSVKYRKTTAAQKSIMYAGIQMYNQVLQNMRVIRNLK